jgi:hypothetical protein
MSPDPCYAIAKLGSAGKPVAYLPYMGTSLTPNRSQAWRFGNRQAAEEHIEVLTANSGSNLGLQVIEIDCDGPPLNLPPPRTL